MNTIPELMAEKQAILEAGIRHKEELIENERLRIEEENKFGDVRDSFSYKLPCFAPYGFKPSKKHKKLCKICYENRINCAFMPCKCEYFCMDCCTTPEILQTACPYCGQHIPLVLCAYRAASENL